MLACNSCICGRKRILDILFEKERDQDTKRDKCKIAHEILDPKLFLSHSSYIHLFVHSVYVHILQENWDRRLHEVQHHVRHKIEGTCRLSDNYPFSKIHFPSRTSVLSLASWLKLDVRIDSQNSLNPQTISISGDIVLCLSNLCALHKPFDTLTTRDTILHFTCSS